MSFDLICNGCGAPSGPSVGICPFCKTLMSSTPSKDQASISSLVELHSRGNLVRALEMATEMEKQKPDLKTDLAFALAYIKVLLESEAPSSKIRSTIVTALFKHAENRELQEYLEILEAKLLLCEGPDDPGELMLQNLLKRSPENIYAHFILGGHLFWIEHDSIKAISHLETCVRLQPNFLRAWGCLGAVYKKSATRSYLT